MSGTPFAKYSQTRVTSVALQHVLLLNISAAWGPFLGRQFSDEEPKIRSPFSYTGYQEVQHAGRDYTRKERAETYGCADPHPSP